MVTKGGLKIVKIREGSPLRHVTFDGYSNGKRTHESSYFPDQTFDIALDGATIKGETNMAQRVNITVESDLSGKPDASTVEFALDGTAYTIDLTDDEQEKFRKAFAQYVGAATPLKGKGKSKGRGAAAQAGTPAKVVREWAAENGYEVPERGRIPSEVREAYEAAH
jgi:hypothetical protein